MASARRQTHVTKVFVDSADQAASWDARVIALPRSSPTTSSDLGVELLLPVPARGYQTWPTIPCVVVSHWDQYPLRFRGLSLRLRWSVSWVALLHPRRPRALALQLECDTQSRHLRHCRPQTSNSHHVWHVARPQCHPCKRRKYPCNRQKGTSSCLARVFPVLGL